MTVALIDGNAGGRFLGSIAIAQSLAAENANNPNNSSSSSSVSPLAQKLGSGGSDGSGDASGLPELIRQMLLNKNQQNQGPHFMGQGADPGFNIDNPGAIPGGVGGDGGAGGFAGGGGGGGD